MPITIHILPAVNKFDPEDWKILAEHFAKAIEEFNGLVVLHGSASDTLRRPSRPFIANFPLATDQLPEKVDRLLMEAKGHFSSSIQVRQTSTCGQTGMRYSMPRL